MSAPALPREVWAYNWCDEFVTADFDREKAEQSASDDCDVVPGSCSPIGRYVLADDAQLICPVCLAAHEPVPVCHECVRLKAKREAEEEIVAWLRSRRGLLHASENIWSYDDIQALSVAASALERGEHRKAGR